MAKGSVLFLVDAKDGSLLFTLDTCEPVLAVEISTIISANDFVDKMRTSDN